MANVTTTQKNHIDEIKRLYAQVNAKSKFIEDTAGKLNRSPLSLRTHWFSNFWAIPPDHQAGVLRLLKSAISKQK